MSASKTARRALLAIPDTRPAAAGPSVTTDGGADDSASDSDSDDGMAAGASSRRGRSFALRAQSTRGKVVRLSPSQRAERCFQRMLVAMRTGAGAVLGSWAELVLGFCGTTR